MTRVILIDGGLSPDHPGLVLQQVLREGRVGPHSRLHATALAAAVAGGCQDVQFANLVIFAEGLSTDTTSVARAFGRAAALDADVVLCAFGLTRDDPRIAENCALLVARGATVVAAAPARGARVYPAALDGVVAVQGDARCTPATWSHLALPHAEFGAAPCIPGFPEVAGASAAVGHFAGHVAARLRHGVTGADVLHDLRQTAAYQGRERRGFGAGHDAPTRFAARPGSVGQATQGRAGRAGRVGGA